MNYIRKQVETISFCELCSVGTLFTLVEERESENNCANLSQLAHTNMLIKTHSNYYQSKNQYAA